MIKPIYIIKLLPYILISIIIIQLMYPRNKEGFLNMEKKYKNMKQNINKNLEGMINTLPNRINIRRKVKNFKRKFIS